MCSMMESESDEDEEKNDAMSLFNVDHSEHSWKKKSPEAEEKPTRYALSTSYLVCMYTSLYALFTILYCGPWFRLIETHRALLSRKMAPTWPYCPDSSILQVASVINGPDYSNKWIFS